jgi:hypothetical protein
MNDPRPVPPSDDVRERDLAAYVRRFRSFLRQENIDEASQQLADLDAEGNPFRSAIVREKQPWVDAFLDFDRRTLNGTRLLRMRGLPISLLRAAACGKTLERVEATLSEPLKDHMRARLLALHGLSEPVMMEWDVAHFYLRHGFRLTWTVPGTPGPEFRCERGDLRFEVECKRVTRFAKEILGDRDATTLGYGVVRALADRNLCGDIVLDTLVRRSPSEAEVVELVQGAISMPAPPFLDIDVPTVGRISGEIRAIPDSARVGIRNHIVNRCEQRSHDFRGFGCTVPLGAQRALDSIVLWLRGPRRSQAEHLAHIESRVTEAAEQLSDDSAGLVAIEMEGITDAELFRDRAPFREMNIRAFQANPSLAAMLWRCDLDFVAVQGGFSPNHLMFVERNGDCHVAGAAEIPLLDQRD